MAKKTKEARWSTIINTAAPQLNVALDTALRSIGETNPPFNLKGWYNENLKNDSRWTDYATPPESNANYAWILHMLSHLKPLSGVADTYHLWQSEGTDGKDFAELELYRSVDIEEIKANNWTLAPSKYIEFIDHDLEIDYPKEMARIQQEMKELIQREKDSQIMLAEAFKGIGYEIE